MNKTSAGKAAAKAAAPRSGLWRSKRSIAIAAASLAAIIGAWWYFGAAGREFDALASAGEPALKKVENIPASGVGSHLRPGESYTYRDGFPTSGPHDPSWVSPGIYASGQAPTRLVHSLEHGMIVIYHDRLDAADRNRLESWAKRYDGQWDGIVLVPRPGLGSRLMLTAWGKRLQLETFDAPAAAAFIDAFRGRGPEKRVR
jgi:Protein of unknown function (DUF3105)